MDLELPINRYKVVVELLVLLVASAIFQTLAVLLGILSVYFLNLDLLVVQVLWALREAAALLLHGSLSVAESWLPFPDPIFVNRLKIALNVFGPFPFFFATSILSAIALGLFGWLLNSRQILIVIPILAFPITRQLISNPYMFTRVGIEYQLPILVVLQCLVATLVAVLLRELALPRLPKI